MACWEQGTSGCLRDPDDTLAAKLDLWRGKGQIVREREELFTEVGWLQVLAGQGVATAGWHPLADAIPEKDLREFLDTIEALYRREVAQWPTHAEFIATTTRLNTDRPWP